MTNNIKQLTIMKIIGLFLVLSLVLFLATLSGGVGRHTQELRNDLRHKRSMQQCTCLCKGGAVVKGDTRAQVSGRCRCGDLRHFTHSWCRCRSVTSELRHDLCSCQCSRESCPSKYTCSCRRNSPWCKCRVKYNAYREKFFGLERLCNPRQHGKKMHKSLIHPKKINKKAHTAHHQKLHINRDVAQARNQLKSAKEMLKSTPKHHVVKKIIKKEHEQCDCQCKGRRFRYIKWRRHWGFVTIYTGRCICHDLRSRSSAWCQCDGKPTIIGTNRCMCKCGGKTCKTSHLCFCRKNNLNHCKCMGLRKVYRIGGHYRSNNGLCEVDYAERNVKILNGGESMHKCRCMCSGVRKSPRGGGIFYNYVHMKSGNCNCGDLVHHSQAKCSCTGPGIDPKDICTCNCGHIVCSERYTCSCYGNVCRCRAIHYHQRRPLPAGVRVPDVQPLCKPTNHVEARAHQCSCRCNGYTKKKVGYFGVIHTNTGQCQCTDMLQSSSGQCKCWGPAYAYRSNCHCQCGRTKIQQRTSCYCRGRYRHLCTCQYRKPINKMAAVKHKPEIRDPHHNQYPRFTKSNGVKQSSKQYTTLQKTPTVYQKSAQIKTIVNKVENNILKSKSTPHVKTKANSVVTTNPHTKKPMNQKSVDICHQYPVYACAVKTGGKTHSRKCPDVRSKCNGDVLPVTVSGQQATYTFCSCPGERTTHNYVLRAIQHACSPSLIKDQNLSCPANKTCAGGLLGMNFNNQLVVLKYCVQNGTEFDLLSVYGDDAHP